YGEHGALLACSQLVDLVPGTDEKLFQATQVMDEARHNEVLERYLAERLGGLHYPMPANERELFDSILGERDWWVKTVGLQLVAETFAVALFKMLTESARDPVLKEICRRILQDEARHMGFGMLALPEIVAEASAAERKEMEEYTCFALEKTLTGFFPADAYRNLGFSADEIRAIQGYRRDAARRSDYAVYRKHFKRELHASVISNLTRIGLLTDAVRPRLEALGISLPAA
ncbi:MAG: ferritin-like domain-containing protein, partial [Candidatus Methylomirabilia bacterium]